MVVVLIGMFFRLAETYLLRAEAYVWIGGADNLSKAAADINEVRKRAGAKPAGNEIGLDDVLDERARELYVEEFRRTELVRIAYIMASKSINGYTLDNMGEKNFFYDRVIDKNNFYKENYEYKKSAVSTVSISCVLAYSRIRNRSKY